MKFYILDTCIFTIISFFPGSRMDDMHRDKSPSPIREEALVRDKKNLRRKSSMAHSIRRSRSMTGIAFEDQVGAIDTSAPVSDKLSQLASISLSAASRSVQREYDNIIDDNPQADLVDHLKSRLGMTPLLSDKLLAQLVEQVDALSSCKGDHVPSKVVPPRLQALNEAVARAESESVEWKDLHQSRKNRYHAARVEKKLTASGDKHINHNDKCGLSKGEDAWLRGLSDGRGELSRLQKQRDQLASAAIDLTLQIGKRRRLLDSNVAELEAAVSKIKDFSEDLHNADTNSTLGNDRPMLTQADMQW